ncbi:type I-E CRISPR-associated protein Cse1/CasA [Streptomyces sp. NPDC000927]|uniref:type I-E CRISPR-associated protein Cse1/CasA n=1 Tax=Streptomyces sp. NPDC000927 TaxID=3154371 RepID=UPI0033193497
MPEASVRLRTRADLTQGELAQLPEGSDPGSAVTLTIPEAMTVLHLMSGYAASTPACEAMLRRHFTAMFVRITGLDEGDEGEWTNKFREVLKSQKLSPEAVHAYTSQFVFDLADPERPYLQNPALRHECSKTSSVGRLHASRPSGNNAVFWNHTPEDEPMDPLSALEGILLWHGYGECGLGSSRTHEGVTSKTMRSAPYRATVSYFPECANLFLSTLLSCPPPSSWPKADSPDLAIWETQPNDPFNPPAPSGPVSLLAGRTAHHVLAGFNDSGNVTKSWVAWGVEGKTPMPTARDPFILDREKGGALRGDHRRALLRDFDSLLQAASAQKGATAPTWMTTYSELAPEVVDSIGPVQIRAIGFEQDMRPMGDSIAYTATTPEAVASYLSDARREGAQLVSRARKACEGSEVALVSRLNGLRRDVDPTGKNNPWTTDAKTLFWAQADTFFWSILKDGGDPVECVVDLAIQVYDEVTSDISGTEEGFMSTAKHRKWLNHDLRKITD